MPAQEPRAAHLLREFSHLTDEAQRLLDQVDEAIVQARLALTVRACGMPRETERPSPSLSAQRERPRARLRWVRDDHP